MARTKQNVTLTQFYTLELAVAALLEKVEVQETQIKTLTGELSTLKDLFEDFQKVPGDDDTTQCFGDGGDVADLNDFADAHDNQVDIQADKDVDEILLQIVSQVDEETKKEMDPKVKKVKKTKKPKKKYVKKVLSQEVVSLKEEYKTLYGDGPRGSKCNNIAWLEKEIKEFSPEIESLRKTYKGLYGKNPSGKNAKNPEWLKKKITDKDNGEGVGF